MTTLFLKIKTIPTKDPAVMERITADIKHPGSMKKPETIAKWEREQKPVAVAEAIEKTSFDGGYGQVIAIGYALDDHDVSVLRVPDQDASGAAETKLLLDFSLALTWGVNDVWCGHNVKDFDLRFLFHRAIVRGCSELRRSLPANTRSGDPRVFDTMTEWAGWGNRISLDELSAILGTSGKTEGFGGADVWPTFQRPGGIEKIADYCAQDVEAVREIYRRMTA